MKSYEVIDNFLPKEDFKRLQEILPKQVPFYFQKTINGFHSETEKDTTFYMTHMLYNWENNFPVYSTFFDEYKIILDNLEVKSLKRMKINLYPKTDKIENHKSHYDYAYEHKGCIFSLNTCDGATILEDGTEIKSVANRALLFNPEKLHSSTSTTNVKARLNVNINYF
jgi:hypothetical protein|tara:strand:+ start:1306 stop:1809 length:504 start_codon:yes stop_codon:yes gene_type:complete